MEVSSIQEWENLVVDAALKKFSESSISSAVEDYIDTCGGVTIIVYRVREVAQSDRKVVRNLHAFKD